MGPLETTAAQATAADVAMNHSTTAATVDPAACIVLHFIQLVFSCGAHLKWSLCGTVRHHDVKPEWKSMVQQQKELCQLPGVFQWRLDPYLTVQNRAGNVVFFNMSSSSVLRVMVVVASAFSACRSIVGVRAEFSRLTSGKTKLSFRVFLSAFGPFRLIPM